MVRCITLAAFPLILFLLERRGAWAAVGRIHRSFTNDTNLLISRRLVGGTISERQRSDQRMGRPMSSFLPQKTLKERHKTSDVLYILYDLIFPGRVCDVFSMSSHHVHPLITSFLRTWWEDMPIKDISRPGSAGALRRGWFIIPAPADQWPLLLFRKICLEAVTSHWSAGANRRINHKPLRAPRPADVFPPQISCSLNVFWD